VNRRTFLKTTAAAAAGSVAAAPMAIPIIDTHIHLFDPRRKEGVPWPPKDDEVLYKPALPERYRKIAVPLGVVGAIKVEASPWLEDNQWVLDTIEKDKLFVGMVGNIEPGKPDFKKSLERFHKNKLFLGIRCGNLWDRDLAGGLDRSEYVGDLKLLAEAGLSMDTANQNEALIHATLRATDLVPNLRVVVDHLPQFAGSKDAGYLRDLSELGKRPQVYAKVSEVLRRVDGNVPLELSFYKERLDQMWEIFGEDKLVYGSDWPNSDKWAEYPKVLGVAREYLAGKGQAASEKVFWKNSVSAYRWVKRDSKQPHL
jgi:predicted TIM-barrel fold metal-dependent hydrolase